MSAISVAQARRVAELAFMGFLFFLLRNVMSAISVAQARRVAELVFMGFPSFSSGMSRVLFQWLRHAESLNWLSMTFRGEISLIQSHEQC